MTLFGSDNQQPKSFPPGVGVALFLLLAVALWQLVAMAIGASYIVPTPVQVLMRALELVVAPSFWMTVAWSLLRVLAGFACGMFVGTGLAIPMAESSRLRSIFSPFIKVIRTVPVVCFILLLLLWVRADWLPALVSALMVVPVAWTGTVEALDALDQDMIELAHVFQLSTSKRLFKLYLPAIAPQLLSTAAVGLGLAWKSAITAEALALPLKGMGTDIYHAKIALEATDIFVWALVIVAISLLMETAIRAWSRHFSEWGSAS
ncbi:MAG: ABC transporter permease subunit [Atopobiaceae bacterium]|nr:ABC transporter permease subunit [Atopobiaceae bacterium]